MQSALALDKKAFLDPLSSIIIHYHSLFYLLIQGLWGERRLKLKSMLFLGSHVRVWSGLETSGLYSVLGRIKPGSQGKRGLLRPSVGSVTYHLSST